MLYRAIGKISLERVERPRQRSSFQNATKLTACEKIVGWLCISDGRIPHQISNHSVTRFKSFNQISNLKCHFSSNLKSLVFITRDTFCWLIFHIKNNVIRYSRSVNTVSNTVTQSSRGALYTQNKQLSYRRETVLQGGSVLAKNGRRYSADNIGLPSTTVTW